MRSFSSLASSVAWNTFGLAVETMSHLSPVSSQVALDIFMNSLGWEGKGIDCFGAMAAEAAKLSQPHKCDKLTIPTTSWEQEHQQLKDEVARLQGELQALRNQLAEDKMRQEQARQLELQELEAEQAEMEMDTLTALAQQRDKYEKAREMQQQEHEAERSQLEVAVYTALAQQQAEYEQASTANYQAGYRAGFQAGKESAANNSKSYLCRAVSPKSEGFVHIEDSGRIDFVVYAQDPYAAEPSCKRLLF